MSVRPPSTATVRRTDPCTWEELSRHNSEHDCWVAVDGKVYDITSWLPVHPGGKDMLLFSAGRDITNLFESYHPFTNKPAQVLAKYYVGDISSTEFPRYTTKSPFYDALRKRVSNYFLENNVDPQKSWRILARMLFVYLGVFATYYITHFVSFKSIIFPIFSAFIYGIFMALFSMHALHDSSHASITHSPAVWRWVAFSFDLMIGGSCFSWFHQHVIGHHLYTNVKGADPDIGENDPDFRRISPHQKWYWFYRFQYLYAPLMYGLLSIKYRIQDFGVMLLRTNGRIRVANVPLFYFMTFVIGKAVFVATRLVIPLFFMPWTQLLLTFIIAEFILGYYLAFNFQVSHVAPGLEFFETPIPPAPAANIHDDWAILQVKTTQDYGHGSFVNTFFSGPLNYQVVHHLFPSISQTYYPQIAPIVLKTCEEYGVKYKVLPGFWAAFTSHITYLKQMGKPPSKEA
jgi:fatty acid desaturase/predicted heme/steroid binding protein